MHTSVAICFSLAVSGCVQTKKLQCLRLPSSPPIPSMTLFQPFGFSLNFLAQNKVLYEGGLSCCFLAWLEVRRNRRNLTNRSALARLPAKLRGLAMRVETQVLSTLPRGARTCSHLAGLPKSCHSSFFFSPVTVPPALSQYQLHALPRLPESASC